MKQSAPVLLLAMMLAGSAGAGAASPAVVDFPAAQHLVVDLDGDGGRDEVSILLEKRLGTFVIVVRYEGQDIRPFTGDWRPGDTIGLEWRVGGVLSDVKCRNWQPGIRCGYPVGSHSEMRVIAVHHSRLGQYVLAPRTNVRIIHEPLDFHVFKAFEATDRLRDYG